MSDVLITGCEGFVGSAFAAHFGVPADHPLGKYKFYNGCGDLITGVDIVSGLDIRECFKNSVHYDLVIHCAAVVGGRAMIDGSPLHLAAEDLSIDAEMFRWALRTRPGRIVYFSSSAAYPTEIQGKKWVRRRLHEGLIGDMTTEIGAPDATYGWVKLTGERLAAEANAIGIPVHVFRPFSGYGPGQSLDYPFPSFIRRGLQREAPFDIWGDGASARDWVHIDDIVGAVMAAIDQDVRGPVNICTGRATTFDEFADMVKRRAGYETCNRYVGDAPQGVHWRVGDPTLLHTFYTPRITLEEGIARALEAAT